MASKQEKERFFREHYAYARQAGLSDVQARLAVSQAAVETGWGEVGQAVKGNNFHGMKVGDDWAGKSVNLPTREETKKGKSYTVNADFRQYDSPVDSYRDWAAKMATNWPGVMTADTFSEAVAALDNGVKGVYATAKAYASSLKDVNAQLTQSGIPTGISQPSPFDSVPSAGPAGWAYGDLVKPTSVKTTTIGAAPSPGLAALAPNGLIGDPATADPDGYRTPIAEVDFTRIAGMEPHLAERFNQLRDQSIAQGLNLGVDVGAMVRDQAKQNELAASGASKTKQSFHMLGLAADISPMDATKANNWASPQWGGLHALRDGLGLHGIGAWDPAHIQAFPGSASAYMGLPRDDQGIVQLSPEQIASIAGYAAPVGDVARLSLPDITPAASLGPIASETISPQSFAFEQAAPSLAQMFSPISSAEAATPIGVQSLSPLEATETVVGTDVTPGSNFASRESFPGTNRLTDPFSGTPAFSSPMASGLLGGIDAGWKTPSVQRGIQLASLDPVASPFTRNDVADFYASESPTISALSPEHLSPLSASESLGPLRPEQISPLQAPSLSPLTSQTISPIGATQTLSPIGATQTLSPIGPTEVISPIPDAPPSSTVSPVPSSLYSPTLMGPPQTFQQQPPQQNTFAPPATEPDLGVYGTPQQTDDFPATPDISNWSKFKHVAEPIANDAILGSKLGPLGAIAGGIFGALPAFGIDTSLPPGFDNSVPQADRFSTGFGLEGIMGAMGGPYGAQGFSLSNPGASYTSLGERVGTGGVGLRRSDKYGWTEVVGPGGEVRGIHFDDPNGGGFIGSISRAFGERLGGDISDAERSSFSGKAGLF